MAITYISSVSAGSSNGSSVTTSGMDTSNATFLCLAVGYAVGKDPSVSDNKGNAWVALPEYASTYSCVKMFYCVPLTVGTGHTFTVSTPSSGYPAIAVSAYSGVAGSPVDQMAGAGFNSETNGSPGSVTGAFAHELFITAVGTTSSPTINGVDPAFTRNATVQTSATHGGVSIAHYIQPDGAEAKNPGWTMSAPTFFACTIVTFRAAGVSAGAAVSGSLTLATTPLSAPVTVDFQAAMPSSGRALGTFMRFGSAGIPAPPIGGDSAVGEFMYLPSTVTSTAGHGLWCYNPVVNILGGTDFPTVPDVGASIIEVDLQNGKYDPSTVPFTSYPPPNPPITLPRYSKTGVTAVIGPSTYDSTAAFACIVNFPANDKGWLYGYWSGGVRTAAFHADRWSPRSNGGTNGSGNWDPDIAFSNATNATTLLKSTGSHSVVIDAPNIHVYQNGSAPGTNATGLTVKGGSDSGRTVVSSAVDGVLEVFYTGSLSSNTAIGFIRGTTAKGSISTDASGAYFNSFCDARLKEDIRPLSRALDIVARLRPVTFQIKETDGTRRTGLIAQELAVVVPEIVFGDPNATTEAGEVVPMQADYSKLVPILIGAIQELASRHRA